MGGAYGIRGWIKVQLHGDADALLTELANAKQIIRYEVDGVRYIAIPTFGEHQNPHVKELPSTYLRRNIRFGSQPMPNTPTKADLTTFLSWLHADEILVFASDYPHWDWDEPSTFMAGFDPDFRRRVMYETARDLYGL